LIDTYYLTGNCNNCDSNYCNYCIYPPNNYLYYVYACTTSTCFLSSATIELESGKHKTMDELSVGDRVLVSDKSFSDVYMFGHKDHTTALHPSSPWPLLSSSTASTRPWMSSQSVTASSSATNPTPMSTCSATRTTLPSPPFVSMATIELEYGKHIAMD
jgi:hypothetical protein